MSDTMTTPASCSATNNLDGWGFFGVPLVCELKEGHDGLHRADGGWLWTTDDPTSVVQEAG